MVSGFKRAFAAFAALALLAGPAAAQVPDPFARELAQKLSQGEALLRENGYQRAAGPFAGGLNQGGARRHTIMLRVGQDYRILGVCDERCRDVDLRLFINGDQLVAQDVLTDAVPIVHVRPAVTGNYEVEAVMARCNGAPCWYAFNVYSR
ncbi:MAG: hypothetical protein K2P70_03345 [Hyphomonadaceae bacterium]|nr:hypothetical protein [Hyphomonadaceae bacterium]